MEKIEYQTAIIERGDLIKIKSEIKLQLGRYLVVIDDVLLEYIVQLILNENTKFEFQEKLKNFLGDKSKEFTNFVWELCFDISEASKKK